MPRLLAGWVLLVVTVASWGDDKPKEEPVKLPELRAELLARTKVDQEIRQSLVDFMKKHSVQGAVDFAKLDVTKKKEFEQISNKMRSVDQENTQWLIHAVDKHGWPGVSLVGKEAAGSAWLLVQHADRNPKFQRRCLDLMTTLPKGEVSQSNLAYLTDRVLLAEGKKQLYGTQFSSQGGEMKPSPIEDEEKVDVRRKEMGLPPLAEYAEVLRKQYGGSPGK